MVDLPDAKTCLSALEATWPAAGLVSFGPFLMRDGAGGGKRVSAATAVALPSAEDIASVEAAQRAQGLRPLFRLCPHENDCDAEFDKLLAERGYAVIDRTLIMAVPLAALLSADVPNLRFFAIWPPLEIQRQIWSDAGIGAARQAIMGRVGGAKTSLLARMADRAAGSAFVACEGPVAMLHAMEIAPALRRKGAARNLMHGAAIWAKEQGAQWMTLAVTEANLPARALYDGIGMKPVAAYHYREAPLAAYSA